MAPVGRRRRATRPPRPPAHGAGARPRHARRRSERRRGHWSRAARRGRRAPQAVRLRHLKAMDARRRVAIAMTPAPKRAVAAPLRDGGPGGSIDAPDLGRDDHLALPHAGRCAGRHVITACHRPACGSFEPTAPARVLPLLAHRHAPRRRPRARHRQLLLAPRHRRGLGPRDRHVRPRGCARRAAHDGHAHRVPRRAGPRGGCVRTRSNHVPNWRVQGAPGAPEACGEVALTRRSPALPSASRRRLLEAGRVACRLAPDMACVQNQAAALGTHEPGARPRGRGRA
jgi:hypothetical protein